MYVHTQFINAAVIVHIQLLNFLNHHNYVIIINIITEVIFFCSTDNSYFGDVVIVIVWSSLVLDS